MTDERLIGTAEAADILGVDKVTVTRIVARGDLIPVHKLPGENGAFLFERADIQRLADARTAAASA